MHRRFSVVLLFICLLLACSTGVFAKEANHVSAGDALDGTNEAVYDYLSQQIGLVASGAQTTTVFAVSAAELGLDQVWTAEDLGVERIWANSSSIFPNADAALTEKVGLDMQLVVDALLADHPYELYWFDKSYGVQEEYYLSGTIGSSGETVYITDFYFWMTISQDYAVIEGRTWYPYDLDSTKQAKVPAAVAEAKRVVDLNKNKSDYEKLLAYKDYICNVVSYNKYVASMPNYPYGDPWQLISVFDNNSKTNVVCEGYAKAFKYLCDLTDFEADVQCILADGWTDTKGGIGKGEHMWNILIMPDGESYLVDVTNSDEGSVGHPDYLFLTGDDSKGTKHDSFSVVVPEHSVGNGYIAREETLIYTYNNTTLRLWEDAVLKLSTENYAPVQVDFVWAEDFRSCTALINGQSLTCQVETQQEENQLTLTASVVYNDKTYTDEEIIHLEREELVLPKLFTYQHAETVWMLIAGYTEGRLTDLQLVEHAVGGTYDLSNIVGTDIQVFFLNNSNQAPLLPSLSIH